MHASRATRTPWTPRLALAGAAVLALAACGGGQGAAGHKIVQTGFPGQVTAGGGTSGAVLGAHRDMTAATNQAGTPGIPQGSGGNTSGAALGGTTERSALANTGEQTSSQQSRRQAAPVHTGAASAPAAPVAGNAAAAASGVAAGAAAAALPAASAAVSEAERQKQLLDQAMTRVAERWHARQAAAPATAASR